jgi:uncharacterized membrane protein YcaP (DUF421 family)
MFEASRRHWDERELMLPQGGLQAGSNSNEGQEHNVHWSPSLLQAELNDIFNPHIGLLEIIFRGSIIYLALFFLLRVARSRHAGETSISDILLITLIADAVQNGMASEYRSVTEGLTLACTIFFWAFFLDWLAFHYPRLRPIIQSGPRCVVRKGVVQARALRHELLSEDDLMALLRKQGIDDIADVKQAYVEGDGRISVIPVRKS